MATENDYLCVYVCLLYYLFEDAGSYESTSGVEGPSATNVQVSLIKRLQNSQEVGTLQLDREKHRERDHNVRNNGGWSIFCHIVFIHIQGFL